MTTNNSELPFSEIEKMARSSDSASFSRLMGMRTIRVERGYALTSMTVKKEKHMNFLGLTHGAVLFALADHACSVCGNSLGRKAVLIQTNMNLFSNTRPGTTIEAEAKILAETEVAGTLDIVIREKDAKTLARCQSIVFFVGSSAQGVKGCPRS